jgi:hypothetical protein
MNVLPCCSDEQTSKYDDDDVDDVASDKEIKICLQF